MGSCISSLNPELNVLKNYNGNIDVYADQPYPTIAFNMVLGRCPTLEHRVMKLEPGECDRLVYSGNWNAYKRFRLTIESCEWSGFRTFRTIRPPRYRAKLEIGDNTSSYYIYGL